MDKKIQRLPIISSVRYKLNKVLKYHIYSSKIEIHKIDKFRQLKRFRKVQCITHLQYNVCDNLNPFKYMNAVNRVRKLTINFSNIKDLHREKRKYTLQILRRIRVLSHVEFLAHETEAITNAQINKLCKVLIAIVDVKDIKFEFFRCYKITEEGPIMFLESCKQLRKLKRLSLLLESCHDQTSKGLVRFGDKVKQCKNLISFKFSLCALSVFVSRISEEHMLQFVECLNTLEYLKHLYLHFRNCSMTGNQGLINFSKKVTEMKKLTHLYLYMSGFVKVTNLGFMALGKYLGLMNGLEDLTVDLRNGSDVSDECIVKICHELSNLPRINKLSLNFSYCPKVTSKGVSELSESLPKFRTLKFLRLQLVNFSLFDPQIGQESLLKVIESVSKLTQLEGFHFNFGNSPALDDSFVISALEDLIKLKNLKKLMLTIENLSQLSDKSLKVLGKKLSEFENLKALDFCLDNCYNVTDEGLTSFLKRVNKKKSLIEVELNFPGCCKLTEEVVTYAKAFTEEYI